MLSFLQCCHLWLNVGANNYNITDLTAT